MAEIKKISTELQLLDKFLDTSGDAGTSGQVLTSTGTGINWVSGGSLPGGPYLPLSAGPSYPLTNSLYISSSGANGLILKQDTSAGSNSGRLFFQTDTAAEGVCIMNVNGRLDFRTSSDPINTSGNTKMVLTNAGSVGIGTTNIGTESNLYLGANSSAEGGQITLQKATSGTLAAHIDAHTTGGKDYMRILSGGDTSTSAAPFVFDLTNVRVGIGTPSPNEKLEVNGAVAIGNATDGIKLRLTGTVGEILGLSTTSGSYNDLDIRSQAATQLYLKANGYVGIKTTNPQQPFVVANTTDGQGIEIVPGSSGIIQAYDRTAGDYVPLFFDARRIQPRATEIFTVSTGNAFTERLRITAAGNVGIGTTSPNEKLRVESTTSENAIANTVKISHARSNTDVATNALYIDMNLSGADATTADRTNRGIFIDVDSTADGDASNEHRIRAINSDVRFSGFSDAVQAGYFYAESNNSTQKTAQLVGVFGNCVHDSSTTSGGVSNMYGVYGNSDVQDLGDVDNAFGGFFQVNIGGARGNANIGVSKGVEGQINIDKAQTIDYGTMVAVSAIIDNNEGAVPNFGNQFLFKGDYQGTRGSDAYGIYCEGDKHYLEGNLGVGTSGPTQKLHVAGNARVTGAYYDSNNSPGTANQVLVSTETGTDWVDGSGSSIIGGPYLPKAGGVMDSNAIIGGSGTLELGGTGVTNLLFDSDGTNIMQLVKASASLQYAQIISNDDKVRLRFRDGMDIYYDDTAIINYMKFHALGSHTTQFKNEDFEIIGIGTNNDETLFKAEGGGAVSLYHNNVLQLNTTSTGIQTNTIDATVSAGSAGNFVVMDGTRLAYRTAAQVLSDIGAMTGFGVSNLVSGTGSTFTITNGQTVGILGGTNITSSVNTTNETITLSTLNPASGNWFRGVPQIGGDGLMEVGRYIDFHNTNTATNDFDVRLDCRTGNELRLTGTFKATSNIIASSQIGAGITPAAGIRVDVEGKIRSNDSNSGDYLDIYCDGSGSGNSFIENTNSSIILKSANATTVIDASGAAAVLDIYNASNVATIRLKGDADSFIAGGDLGIGNTGPVSGIKLDVTGKVLIKTSNGISDLYLGNFSTNKYVRFHTNNSDTYFDMGCGLVYWRNPNSIKMTFDVANGNMTIDGTLTQNSDIKVKENIVEIDNCIGKVQAMRGVYYNRNDVDKEITKVGVIAQEVEAVLPELILEHPKDGLKSVAYSELTAVLINAIKEQQEIIEDLKTRITKLEN